MPTFSEILNDTTVVSIDPSNVVQMLLFSLVHTDYRDIPVYTPGYQLTGSAYLTKDTCAVQIPLIITLSDNHG